jgi:hypothetical protein
LGLELELELREQAAKPTWGREPSEEGSLVLAYSMLTSVAWKNLLVALLDPVSHPVEPAVLEEEHPDPLEPEVLEEHPDPLEPKVLEDEYSDPLEQEVQDEYSDPLEPKVLEE